MKYLMMVTLDRNSEAAKQYEAGTPPDPKLMEAMTKLMGDLAKSGKLVDAAGLWPVSKGARVRAAGGKVSITDGPFIESKEVIGGYAVIEAATKEEALEHGKTFMQTHVDALGASYVGEVEIRQMSGPGECGEGESK